MKRLTREAPKDNFETMLNFVYSKDGWAHIRYTSEIADVPLTQWAKTQCILRGCAAEDLPGDTPEEIDEALCGCMMDCPDCPIALAYCFACQASHLRDRLKLYEDILFSEDSTELIAPERLRDMMEAEQSGRLAVLPCRVGDTVFDIQDGTPYATRVLSFSYFGDHWACRTVSSYPDLESFGERVFLTLEEAEAALERRIGGSDETD